MDTRHEPPSGAEEAESDFGVHDVLSVLRRRWRTLLAPAVVATALAVAVVLALPNRFEAVATVQIEPRNMKVVDIDAVLQDLKVDNPTVESEVEIIRSRSIASRVIDLLELRRDAEFTDPDALSIVLRRLGLSRPPRFANEIRPGGPDTGAAAQPSATGHAPGSEKPERDEVVRAFDQRLKVQRVRNTLLIEIKFSSADPVKAARIVNTIAEVYLEAQIAAKRDATEQARELLESRIKGLREKVAEAERQVERFKTQHGIFDTDGQLLLDRQMAREVEALVVARTRTAEARAKYEQARSMLIELGGSESVSEVLQSPTIRLLRDELTKALRREAELSVRYGSKHPEMQRIRADVAKAQAELSTEVSRIIETVRGEYQIAASREAELARALERLKGESGELKGKRWELQELQREAAASRQLYEAMLSRAKQTEETLGLQFADARIVERADVPLYPAAPKRKQIVLLALIAGLIGGAGIVLVLEFMIPGFARPEQIERSLDVACLASIPELGRDSEGLADPLRSVRLMIAAPQGRFAEAIRSLRHALEPARGRQRRHVVMLTSAAAGEGRTVVAANLALDFALIGKRTLLIDGDLRRAGLTGRLGIHMRQGLRDVLGAGVSPRDAILHDTRTGLSVLPAHSGIPTGVSAPEMLARPELASLIDGLRRDFEVIIIDAPPVLPVVDARILARFCDQLVMVMTWRTTPRQLAKRAVRALGADAVRLAGVVVNRVDPGELADEEGSRVSVLSRPRRFDTAA